MSRAMEETPGLLHNIGGPPRASILWRGFGRGPLADDAERIEVARRRGTWLHLTLSIGQANGRYQRDWNTAGALLRLLEPAHALGETAATRCLVERIEEHTERLDWPRCLMVGAAGGRRDQQVTLDHAPTTFVALSKSTGSLWMRDRVPRLAPLHAPTLIEPGSTPMRGVLWKQTLWFPDGIPEGLLSLAMEQAKPQKTWRPNPIG
jgi:hypothetical protein